MKIKKIIAFLTLILCFNSPLFAMMEANDINDPDLDGYDSCVSEDETENDADIPELPPDHQERNWGMVAFWVADIGCLAAIFIGLPLWAYLDQEARHQMTGMMP